MNMKSPLPVIRAEIRFDDPSWVAQRDTIGQVTNMDDYNTSAELDCEVLMLNLNAGTMRVRPHHPTLGKLPPVELSMVHFTNAFKIVSKE